MRCPSRPCLKGSISSLNFFSWGLSGRYKNSLASLFLSRILTTHREDITNTIMPNVKQTLFFSEKIDLTLQGGIRYTPQTSLPIATGNCRKEFQCQNMNLTL